MSKGERGHDITYILRHNAVQKDPFVSWHACSFLDEEPDVLPDALARGHVEGGEPASVAGVDDVAALGAITETISTVMIPGNPLREGRKT